jgi:hypothetical protein
MKYQLVIAILAVTLGAVCNADSAVCAEKGSYYYSTAFNDIQSVVAKLVQDIDREVGPGCMINRKFIENSGRIWGDVEAMGGVCRTSDELKQTLFNVRDYFQNLRNGCRNFRIVSHGDTVASRIRIA